MPVRYSFNFYSIIILLIAIFKYKYHTFVGVLLPNTCVNSATSLGLDSPGWSVNITPNTNTMMTTLPNASM